MPPIGHARVAGGAAAPGGDLNSLFDLVDTRIPVAMKVKL